jgi:hypothetical protein
LASIAAQRAYGTLTSPKAQADAIQAAAEVRLREEPAMQKSIRSMVEEVRKQANKSNNIAHSLLVNRGKEGGFFGYGEVAPDNMVEWWGVNVFKHTPAEYFWGPPFYNSNRMKPVPYETLFGQPDYLYNSEKIIAITSDWNEMHMSAITLKTALPKVCKASDEFFYEESRRRRLET